LGIAEYAESKMDITGIEYMLYEMSGGDLSKASLLKKLPMKDLLRFCYLKRLNQLNELLEASAKYEESKNE